MGKHRHGKHPHSNNKHNKHNKQDKHPKKAAQCLAATSSASIAPAPPSTTPTTAPRVYPPSPTSTSSSTPQPPPAPSASPAASSPPQRQQQQQLLDAERMHRLLPEEEMQTTWQQLIHLGGCINVYVKDALAVPNTLSSEHSKITTMAEQQGKLNALKEINSRTTAESCRLSQENESVTELLKKFKKEVDERLSKLERKTVELERKTVELEKKTTGLESGKKDHTALVERVTVLENFKNITEEQIAMAEMATHLVGQQLNVETPVPYTSLPLECNSDYKFQLCSMMP